MVDGDDHDHETSKYVNAGEPVGASGSAFRRQAGDAATKLVSLFGSSRGCSVGSAV
jgi:hypothetical protein